MTNKIRFAALCSLLCVGSALTAQNTRSGYFLEDYTYRFQLNPAMDNSKNFIAMPALGNMNVSMDGNLKVSDVIYNVDGRTTTFLNPGVSAAEVLGSINDRNRVGAELSFGHSRKINDQWRVGANMKFLLGGGYLDAKLNRADLVLGENDWTITTDAEINTSVKGLKYKTDINNDTNHRYVNGAEIDGGGLNGFGVAFDLGAVYKPARDWTVSLSLLDLGFISWSNSSLTGAASSGSASSCASARR